MRVVSPISFLSSLMIMGLPTWAKGIVDDVKTPFIDALAAGGVRMTHGYSSAPQCS